MKEPRGRKRYVSLLRKRANANWRDLMSAASTAKFKLLRKDRMRLRRKNSFQASKLLRSLRSSAPSKHESKVRSHLRSFDSPETLTKKGKISRVSERSIDKVSSPPPVAQDEREEGEVFAINRRMTRGMDGVKMKTTKTVDAPMCRVLKGSHAEKFQNQGKSTRRAGLKNHEGNMETDNASYTGKLKHQESSAKEDKLNKRVHKVADSLNQGYASKSLIRLDTKQASKSLSQARALSKSPKKMMSEGVTTRQKVGSTTHVQPPRGMKREAKWSRHTRGIRSPDLNKDSNTGGAHEVERKPKRTFSRGMQDDAEDRFSPGDAHRSTDSQLDSEDSHKGGSWSALSERSRKRKTVNELDDPRQLDIGKGRLSLGRSPEIASEQGPVALGKLIESAVKLRRSKRKRSPTRSDYLTDRQKGSQKGSKGIGDKVEYATFQDTKNLEQPYDVIEEKLSHAVAENETPSNLEALRMDPANKSCLVATSPTESGGRQMRPRPLDLEQPLLVLVEGLDEEYYEFDGGSFHRMLGQQPEVKSSCPGQAKPNGSIRKVLHALDPALEKVDSIVIPSFRVCEEPEGSLQHSGLPYILPDLHVTTGFSVENQHAEYDLDEEDEEWLNKYNQSLSPSSTLSVDQFEKIIDLLENKAADANGITSITESLERDLEPVPEECCICNGGENSTSNLLYQCESCHILVHQSCYGIKKGCRSEKKRQTWICKKCEAIAEGKVQADICCSLCCKQGGAFKPSTEPHRYVHIVCALYTNETYFVNPDAMEPIDGLNAADARAKRQRRQCWLCGVREGSAERCSVSGCKSVFHVSCGVTQGASFELQHSNQQVTSVRVYCPRHALEMFGSPKGWSSQGERDIFSQKAFSQVDAFRDTEIGLEAGKQSEISPISSTRRGKKKAPSQRKVDEWVKYGHSMQDRKTSNDEHNLFSITEKSCREESEQGERVGAQLKKGLAMNGVLVEEACAALAEESKASPNLMEGVYLYWVSKRAKQGGPLLHRIQQEHAAKQFGIFNSDEESGATDSLSDGFSFKYKAMDMKVVAAREQLQRLRELSLLVVQRERLKLEIFSLDQDIFKVGLEAQNATGVRQLCSSCKESHVSLLCALCNRATCMSCLIKTSKYTSWRDFLKGSNYVCPDCEQQNIQMHIELACKPYGDREEEGLAGSQMLHAWKEECDSDAALKKSQLASRRKAFILLPRSDRSHQDKLATQAFWETHPKMVFLSELLKDTV